MKFEEIQRQAQAEWETFNGKDRASILIGAGTCGRAAGALEVLSAFEREVDIRSGTNRKTIAQIVQVGCLGLCYTEPLVEIRAQGKQVLYQGVAPKMVSELVSSHIENGEPVASHALAVTGETPLNGIPPLAELPMIKGQYRIALNNCGHIDPTNINHYIARGGYSSLSSALSMEPEAVIDIVEQSLLRGRGGPGFPPGSSGGCAATTRVKSIM